MILWEMEMDNLTNSECCFCLISVARNVTGTPLLTRSQQCSFSDGSWTKQRFVYAGQLLLFLSSHGLNTIFRTFKVRRGFRQHLYSSEYGRVLTRPEFSQNLYFNKYTEHQIRSSHGSRARRNETRISYCSSTRRDQARTSHCVREETKRLRTAPSVRTKQKDQFARFDVRGHKLDLGRIYQAGSVW